MDEGEEDVLLATGSAGGTISAVRELRRHGLTAAVISSQPFCASAWSRCTSRSYKGPAERQSRDFLDMLLRLGEQSPGRVLLPTSDETAWLYTRYASELSQFFRLHQPSLRTMERILDKKLLADAAIRAGVAVVPTWHPAGLDDVKRLAPTLPYPVLIKPRTQVRRMRNDKGSIACSSQELIGGFRDYLFFQGNKDESLANDENGYHDRNKGDDQFLPDTDIPMLQYFVEIGSEGVHSVSGYIDKTGELFVTRHATKILQRSRPAGVGVCFESLPADAELSDAVHRLCRELGYFGIFEVEFIRFEGRWAAIDFNPRLFNQAGMDARRGMPLVLFSYLEAAGKLPELHEAVAASLKADQDLPFVFYDWFTLHAILLAKTLTRRITPEERLGWRRWMQAHESCSVDFAIDRQDPMPGLVHAICEVFLGIRAARRFLRSTPPIATEEEELMLKAPL